MMNTLPTRCAAVVLIAAFGTTAYADPDKDESGHGPRSGAFQCRGEQVGRVLGGLIGGVLGNQVGDGSGRGVATIGGAVVGALIGGEIGRRIDAENQACISQALEYGSEGQRVEWSDGGQAQRYAVVPGRIEQGNGTYCRRYQAEVMTTSGWQGVPGKACRRADGTWVSA